MPPTATPKWHPKARADLLELITYIAADNPNAAQALKDEVEAKVRALPTHPQLYKPGRVEGTREMVVRPNYIVVYRDSAHDITILRVLHAARRGPLAKTKAGRRSDY